MTLNTRQKTMIAIGGLALAGLALDRLVLQDSTTGPESAAASALVVSSAGPGTTPKLSVLPGSPTASAPPRSSKSGNQFDVTPENLDDEGSLARRLSRVAEREQAEGVTTDAFKASGIWVTAAQDASKPGAAKPVDNASGAAEFAAKHRLSALMRDAGRDGIAVIDGKPWRMGETIDGWVIESIAARSVVLRQGSVMVRLELAIPNMTKRNLTTGSDR